MTGTAEPNDFQWLIVVRMVHLRLFGAAVLAAQLLYQAPSEIHTGVGSATVFLALFCGEGIDFTKLTHLFGVMGETVPTGRASGEIAGRAGRFSH
jgi:hypothetical protein